MQWLIDIIFDLVMSRMTGLIVIWSGAIVDIPDGWQYCDGTNGTPDLRDKFVYAAGPIRTPGSSGGTFTHGHNVGTFGHTHDFTSNLHAHVPAGANWLAAGADLPIFISDEVVTGETDSTAGGGIAFDVTVLPTYYSLAYIMKI